MKKSARAELQKQVWEEFSEVYNASSSSREVAVQNGMTVAAVKSRAAAMRKSGIVLKSFSGDDRHTGPDLPYMPTPEEIQEGMRKAQALWSDKEREGKTREDWRRKPVEIKVQASHL